MIRVVSYNCNSVRNNSEIVKSLFHDSDIVLLQELMLEKRDLDILNDFNKDFRHIAFVKDRETEGICEGRPSRGVAIFWRVTLSPCISPVYVDDSIIGIVLNGENFRVLMINVYMPCNMQTIDAFDNYKQSLALLETVIREQNVNQVILIGDFNADPSKGKFWSSLREFCLSMSFCILDELFPNDTFTYLCPTKDSTSWLDHIISTKKIAQVIQNVSVGYGTALYDHFPMYFEMNVSICSVSNVDDNIYIDEFINWHKITKHDRLKIKDYIDNAIVEKQLLLYDVFACRDVNCKDPCHEAGMDKALSVVKQVLLQSTEQFRTSNEERFKIIPGWNENVKDFYNEARKDFLKWKENGKPLNSQLREKMRLSRTKFKSALSNCKHNEKNIRNRKLLESLNDKKYSLFWKEVHRTNKHNRVYTQHIDGVQGDGQISEIFSNKFKRILNMNQNTGFKNVQKSKLTESQKMQILIRFSKEDVRRALSSVKDSIGFDKIHSNHLKFDSELLVELLATLFTGFIIHNYIPIDVLKGIITPILKDNFGDLSDSDNYRPVMNSSVLLKLFEYCLLFRIEPYIQLNDRQHGFRKRYSTDTACFTLKETILNYTNSNSDVYACFIDISKAFDSVNHGILIDKLHMAGMPEGLTRLIEYWYKNQYVRVQYKNSLSEEWKIGNGVRQGGVLSGLFFNIYINSVLDKISSLNIGCSLGIEKSNIIAYADDIVLIAPSRKALQLLVDETFLEASKIELTFNFHKSKSMIFYSHYKNSKVNTKNLIHINSDYIENAESVKYLGYILCSSLKDNDDINRVRSKFYVDFNIILRKFHFADEKVKLYLFKQYCLQFYGSELWFGRETANSAVKQFAIGYHKAIKKILGLSSHESNHFACEQASILMFNHFINKLKIKAIFRFLLKPCIFIEKSLNFLHLSSAMVRHVSKIAGDIYGIETLFDNDIQAIDSRIWYVQNHEEQLRISW